MEKYVNLEMEVISIENNDIITTSTSNDELPKTPLSKKPYEIYEANDESD